MMKKPYATSEDGSIEYRFMTRKYLDDAQNLLRVAFYPYENVCKCIGVSKNPKCLPELEQLTKNAAEDGVSIIAIDKAKDEVIAVAFNKIQVREKPGEVSYFENFAKSCKQPESKAVLDYMFKVDALCNLFDLLKIDCLLEIMFLGTLPECRGKGVASKICEISIEVATKLSRGENIKQSLDDGKSLSLQHVPKAVSAIYTSFITQRIGQKCGFSVAAQQDFDIYNVDGKNYIDIIGNETKTAMLEYKLL